MSAHKPEPWWEDWGDLIEAARRPVKPAPLTPRQKRILKAAREGHPPVELARRFGTTAGAMSTALHTIRALGHDVPKFTSSVRAKLSPVQIEHGLLEQLSDDAKRRGITTRQLASQLLRVILRHDLTAALINSGSGGPSLPFRI